MRTSRPTVTVTTPRKAGRPSISPTGPPTADVHLTLAPEDYDAVWRVAQRERVTVQEVVRRALRAHLPRRPRDPAD